MNRLTFRCFKAFTDDLLHLGVVIELNLVSASTTSQDLLLDFLDGLLKMNHHIVQIWVCLSEEMRLLCNDTRWKWFFSERLCQVSTLHN